MSALESKLHTGPQHPAGRAGASLHALQKRWGVYIFEGPSEDPTAIVLVVSGGLLKPDVRERWVRTGKKFYELESRK